MKRYDADFHFRNTSSEQRKLNAKIIFINVVRTSDFIFLITELNQLINIAKASDFTSLIIEWNQLISKRTHSTDTLDSSLQSEKKKKKNFNKINLSISDIAACLKKEGFANQWERIKALINYSEFTLNAALPQSTLATSFTSFDSKPSM